MIRRPDPEALEYLEADLDNDTSPLTRLTLAEGNWEVTVTHGVAVDQSQFHRAMIQLVVDQPGRKARSEQIYPCSPCMNFAYSWNCPDHPERIHEDVLLRPLEG